MHILVEPSDYVLRNAGDMAMMQIAIERLSALWPDASIQVFSDAPERMPAYPANVRPLDTAGRRIWHAHGFLTKFCRAYLGNRMTDRLLRIEWIARRVGRWESLLRRCWPFLVRSMLKDQFRGKSEGDAELGRFLRAVSEADLMIATGMGGVTDAFPKYAAELLDTIGLARHYGAISVMLGQGIGPLRNPELRAQAKSVLPKVDFLSLRERRLSEPLLYQLGVRNDRVVPTGDDAIELAYRHRTQTIGAGLGVNLRLSSYAEVDERVVDRLRPILHAAAEKYRAPFVPVVISRNVDEADDETIRRLTRGYTLHWLEHGEKDHSPAKVIERIQECRIVVTGSYHAAVFALSVGISAIGLAGSAYYEDKFLGLADQFGAGCSMILLHDLELAVRLSSAIDHAWQTAEENRPKLLEAAHRQIESGKKAYARLFQLVESRRRKSSRASQPCG